MWIIKSAKNKIGNDLNIGEYGAEKVKKIKKKTLSYFIAFELWLFFNASSI